MNVDDIQRKASIDRLTIMGADIGVLEGYINHNSYLYHNGFSKNYGFRYSYKGLNGEVLEIGNKKKIRIDFNPNIADMEQILAILPWIKHPYLTRLDIAIDYIGLDLSDIQWVSKKSRKRNMWVDSNGILQTLYIGAPSSERRYRIYNKFLEQVEKGKRTNIELNQKHWRVEVQQRFAEKANLKDSEYLLEDLFDIIPCSKELDLDYIEDVKERIMIRGILSNPVELNCLSAKTRIKYKKLIRESMERSEESLEIEPPIDVYKKEKIFLANELTNLFSTCSTQLTL